MHHRSRYKIQLVLTEIKHRSLGNNNLSVGKVVPEELTHHRKSLCRGGYLYIRICRNEAHYICRMIRLHMLNNEVIGLSAAKNLCNIIKPFVPESCVNRVEHGDFIVNNNIGIISHSVFNYILSLKKVDIVIIDPYISYIICNIHSENSFQLPY